MAVDKFVDDENVHHKTSNNYRILFPTFYSHVDQQKKKFYIDYRMRKITHGHTTE